MRWVILILACLLLMGHYYAYDFPAILKQHIMNDMNVDSFQYNLLYSLYSIPNMFLPFIGGIIIDYFDIHFSIILFYTLLLVG